MAFLTEGSIINMQSPYEMTYGALLELAASDLVSYIDEGIDNFYKSRSPLVYHRTHYLQNHHPFRADNNVHLKGATLYINVVENPAYHPSMFGAKQVNVVKLMNWGYKVSKNVWFADKPYFGFRAGYHFIEDAIDRFNKEYGKKYGITATLKMNAADYTH